MKKPVLILLILFLLAVFVWIAMPISNSQNSKNGNFVAIITYNRHGNIGIFDKYDSADYEVLNMSDGKILWKRSVKEGRIEDFYELTDRQVDLIRWVDERHVIFTDVYKNEIKVEF